jgi:hypothetical protein
LQKSGTLGLFQGEATGVLRGAPLQRTWYAGRKQGDMPMQARFKKKKAHMNAVTARANA